MAYALACFALCTQRIESITLTLTNSTEFEVILLAKPRVFVAHAADFSDAQEKRALVHQIARIPAKTTKTIDVTQEIVHLTTGEFRKTIYQEGCTIRIVYDGEERGGFTLTDGVTHTIKQPEVKAPSWQRQRSHSVHGKVKQ